MSTKLIYNVIHNCGIDFNHTDTDADIDDQRILKVTLKCFKQMVQNVLPQEQAGGGGCNLKSIIPYMQAYNIAKLTKKTMLPVGILCTVYDIPIPEDLEFDDKVTADFILSSTDIKSINSAKAEL